MFKFIFILFCIMDMDITMEDITVESIIEMVFDNPIKPPKSYGFTFPDYNLKETYEVFLSIFTKGIHKLFHDSNGRVCIKDLSSENINTINKYFHSFGINIIMEIYLLEEYLKKNITTYNNYLITPNTKLNELKIVFNVDNVFYILSFDFI